MVILCIWAAVSFVAGWIWRLYHATGDGRLFNYPVHLSSVHLEFVDNALEPICYLLQPSARPLCKLFVLHLSLPAC